MDTTTLLPNLMMPPMNGNNPIVDAISGAFGEVIKKEIAPLVERIAALESQVQYYIDLIETAKAKGGIAAKLLLGS